MISKSKTKKKLIAIGAIVISIVTVLFLVLVYMTYDAYETNLFAIEEEVIKKYDQEYKTLLNRHQQLAHIYYNEIISNDDIMKTIYDANYTDEPKLDNLRMKLKGYTQDIYVRASQNNTDEINFILYDNTSLLNMSNKELFSYDLDYSISESDKNHMKEDNSYDSHKYRYPLTYNQEDIGYIELYVKYSSITELISSLFNIESAFIIYKPIIDDILPQEHIEKDYSSLPHSDNYYLDKDSLYKPKNSEFSYIRVFEELIDDEFIWKDGNFFSDESTFYITLIYEEIDYAAVFLKVDDIADGHGGYFVFIDEDAFYYTLTRAAIYQYIALGLVWLLIVAFCIFLLINRFKIEKITYYDYLTSAYNRNKLFDYIGSEVKKNDKNDNNLSILLIDIDKFKRINDTYGHLVGDKILKKVSKLLFQNVRSTDMVFRYGGDEFIILLPNTNLDTAAKVAKSINEVVQNYKWENIDSPITLSIGVAQYNTNESIDQLISRSDNMLYKAKEYGRNRVVWDN